MSGQRDQTVNLTAQPSLVRIQPPPPYRLQLTCFSAQFDSGSREKLSGVPEWPKGSDCKSVGSAFDGSNPSPSTIFWDEEIASRVTCCGHRIMAITSAFQADDAGSIPAARSK